MIFFFLDVWQNSGKWFAGNVRGDVALAAAVPTASVPAVPLLPRASVGCLVPAHLPQGSPLNDFCPKTCLAGPGIAPTVRTGEEVGFVVDAKSAGKGKVTCTVLTPDGTEAEADVVENEDGTYDIFYTAAKPGTYVIYVRFGGVDIPNSPFTVMVSQLCSQIPPTQIPASTFYPAIG